MTVVYSVAIALKHQRQSAPILDGFALSSASTDLAGAGFLVCMGRLRVDAVGNVTR